MVDYIFIILTADDCGACNTFKNTNLKKIMDMTSKINNITVHNINLKRRSDAISERYHPQFRKPINGKWYPSFYLFTEHDFYSFNKSLTGKTIGGTFENGTMNRDPSIEYSFDANFVFNWIISNIEKNIPVVKSSVFNMVSDSYNELEQFNVF